MRGRGPIADAAPRIRAPRPGAAWIMAIVASASLWITGEIDAWVIPVQCLCFGVSYFTRNAPPAWRESAVWLNVGMFGITAVTIAKALEGNPATLSLAYFASLSQGLQLLDARPRKSEFLLVALSLFQVILASNLTDSVFFPPLVLIFLVAVTWTLLVHTLRTEAAAAGDHRGAHSVLSPGLVRTTAALSVVSILMAFVVFLALPRIKTSMLRGGLGPGMAVSGFSDRVSLGSIGRIRKDRTVVLRVKTLQGEAAPPGLGYWRGLAFDAFDGQSWSISPSRIQGARIPVSGIPRFGVTFGTGPGPDALVQSIVREPVEAGVLFGAGDVKRIEGPMQHVHRDPNGGLYHAAGVGDRVRYTLWTRAQERDDRALADDETAIPKPPGWRSRDDGTRYLGLPPLDAAVAGLAREITKGADSDAERLSRIEAHLRAEGRYTDDPPDMARTGEGDSRSPVERFLLGELAGHCEYFASGMIVLGRSLGIPMRLVNGFAGGRKNQLGGFTELTRADAHAWVEAHYAGAGWVRYDPTPPDLRWQAAGELSLSERLAELASVIELWWFQRVVDFDSADQVQALRSVFHWWREWRGDGPLLTPTAAAPKTPRADALNPPRIEWPWPLLLFGAVGGAGLLVWRRRKRRPADPPAVDRYRKALRLLSRHRLSRAPHATARDHLDQVARAGPRALSEPFARLTEAYLAQRFGGLAEGGVLALDRDLAALRLALRGRRAHEGAQRAP